MPKFFKSVLLFLLLMSGVVGKPTASLAATPVSASLVAGGVLSPSPANSDQILHATPTTIGAIRRFLNRFQLGPQLIQYIAEENQVQEWQLDRPAERYIAGPYRFLVDAQIGAILEFGLDPLASIPAPTQQDATSTYGQDSLQAMAEAIGMEEAGLSLTQLEYELDSRVEGSEGEAQEYFFRWWGVEVAGLPRPYLEVGLTQDGQLVRFVNAGLFEALGSLLTISQGGIYPDPVKANPSPDGRWTASINSYDGNLFLNDTGSHYVAFPSQHYARSTIWSPDGHYLLAIVNDWFQITDQLVTPDEAVSIWRIRVDGEAVGAAELLFQPPFPVRIGDKEYAVPTEISRWDWSPDGRHLLFWFGPTYGGHDGQQPWVVDVESGEATQLADSALANPGYHSWSPDGSALAITVGGYRSAQTNKWLNLFDAASGTVTTVVSSTEQIPGLVAWSPQGDTIVYAAVETGKTGPEWNDWMSFENPAIAGRRLYLLDVETGEAQRLNDVESFQDAHVWQEDGSQLYYVQGDGSDLTLVIVDPNNPDSGEIEEVPAARRPMPPAVGYYGQSQWEDLLAYRPDAPRTPLPELREVYTDTTLGIMLQYPAGWSIVNGWQDLSVWRVMPAFLPPRGTVDLGPFSARLYLAVESLTDVDGDLESVLPRVLNQSGPGQILSRDQQLTPYNQHSLAIDDHPAIRLETIGDLGEVNHLLLVLMDGGKALVLRGQGDGRLFDAIIATLQLSPDAGVKAPLPKTEPVLWRMHSPYGNAIPDFTLTYDAGVWTMGDGQITALADERCMVGRGGPYEAAILGTAELAGRKWTIVDSNSPMGIEYSTAWPGAGYMVWIQLPDPFRAESKSWCQKAAEAVIDTFEVVDDGVR